VTLRERLRGWMPLLVVVGVAAVGGLVAIPFGGWDTVDLVSDDIPEQPIGQPYVGAQWTIAIDDVYLTDEHPDGYTELEPGQVVLVVVATLENMRDEPEYPLGTSSLYSFVIPGLVTSGEVMPAGSYSTYLARDGAFGPELNPGVPDTVEFVFLADAARFAEGDEVRIGLLDGTPEEADLFEGTRWVDVHTAAEVVVALREER
jgi:hypothetical protein